MVWDRSALSTPGTGAVPFYVGACVAAGAAGIIASIDPVVGIGLCVAAVGVPLAIATPRSVTYLMVVAIYGQVVSVHGITIDRAIAPLALVALAAHFLDAPARLREARPAFGAVAAYTTLAVASLLWTVSISGTINELFSLAIALTFAGTFALLPRDDHDVRRLLWTLAVSSLGLAMVWIVGLIMGVDRTQSAAGDPNFSAALEATSIPLILALATSTRSDGKRFFLYGVVAADAGAILAAVSRGGTLTLVAVVVLIALLPSQALFRSRRQKAAFFLAAALGALALLPITWSSLDQRFQRGLHDRAEEPRADLWAAAELGYRQHPITGMGFGAFKPNSFQLISESPGANLEAHTLFSRRGGEEVHQTYLGSLTELGPLGLLLFLILLVATGRGFVRAARQARGVGNDFLRFVSNGAVLALFAYVVSANFISAETSGRILWLLVGFSVLLPTLALARTPTESGHG
jgi:O-antigen ligase